MNKPPELDVRKGVHIKMLPDTKNEFRIVAFRMGLSMQEILEEFAQRCVASDPYCIKLMEELVSRKREKVYKQLSRTDAESLFSEMENASPFNK